MNKPMDRRQFLKHIGVAALGVIGINTVISAVLDSHPDLKQSKNSLNQTSRGFGAGKYGR